jgi:hypothetical protein
VPIPFLRGEHLILEELIIVSQASMVANVATSSGDTHIPSTTITTGGVPPPNQPSSVRTTMVSTASTSSSGLIPSMAAITAPFTQNVTGPPFSYEMPGFSTSTVLSSSTLQTLGLGAGSSNYPMQGSMGGTSTPFITFPYGGGHMPPSSPSLSGVHQHPAEPNVNSFGAGSQEIPSYNMLVGSTPFSLFDAFGNNTFSSATISAGGNLGYGQQHLVQGTIPAQGAHLGIPSSQGTRNPWQGSIPLPWMSIKGNPFHPQWNPGQISAPMPIRSAGGNPSQNPWNVMQAQPFTSYYGNQPMMSQQAQNPYTSHGYGYY